MTDNPLNHRASMDYKKKDLTCNYKKFEKVEKM